MSFLSLTDYRSKEAVFIDPSTITVIRQVPEATDEPRHTRVEWACGRVFAVKEEAKEIVLRLNPNPTEKQEIQKEDWEVILQCLIDKNEVLRNKSAREEAKSVRRAYIRLSTFLRSASLLEPTSTRIPFRPNDQT
jgi:hypothetical protein